MSTSIDYAQPRRIDWRWCRDVATVVVVMFACGASDSLGDLLAAAVARLVA